MAEIRSAAKPSATNSCKRRRRCRDLFIWTLAVILETSRNGVYGGHHGHRNQGGIEKLLAAGLIAKALSKGGEEGGGGGGHHFVPIHVPVHHHGHHHGHHASASNNHHHHVHHKYVPIPVKHHTNFIIAHHKVPVHVPVPVVKTKVVHVPVEKTKIVPIIVHKGPHHHPHLSHADTILHPKKYKPSFSQPHIALATNPRNKQVRVTSLGKVKQIKSPSTNGTTIQFHRPESPEKWIVVVKTKKRSSIRRNGELAKVNEKTTENLEKSTTLSS